MSQARFQKRQREMARAEKLKAKAARKAERIEAAAEAGDTPPSSHDPSTVMAELEQLHKQFADEQIDFESFEEKKAELISRLVVE